MSAPGSQIVAGVALARHRMGCATGGVAIRARVAKRGRRGTFSTTDGVRRGWGRYPRQGRKPWQAWHLVDTGGGAQGVGSCARVATRGRRGTSATPHGVRRGMGGSQREAGVALVRHHMGCAGGGAAIRARIATRGRRGTLDTGGGARGVGSLIIRAKVANRGNRNSFSTPRVGWRRYPRPGRNAWQAWHCLNTRGGAQGVGSLSAPGSKNVAGVLLDTKGVRTGWDRFRRQGRKTWQA